MQNAQKMILVNPEALSASKYRTVSSETVAKTRLDLELKDILDRTDLAPYDKLQLYNQVLQRYMAFYSHSSKRPVTFKVLHENTY